MGNIKLSDVKLPLGIINGVAESIAWWQRAYGIKTKQEGETSMMLDSRKKDCPRSTS